MIGFAGAFVVAFWNIYETNKRMNYYVKLQERNIEQRWKKYYANVYGSG